jgi:hypothetical protein
MMKELGFLLLGYGLGASWLAIPIGIIIIIVSELAEYGRRKNGRRQR